MSKQGKLTTRLRSIPVDFTWQELRALLLGLGYREVRGDGSRVKFEHDRPEDLISLHRPHPGNIVKRYALRQVVEKLQQAGFIE